MKHMSWILLLPLAFQCFAHDHCSPTALSQAAAQALAFQKELQKANVGDLEDDVPAAIADKITQLKDALNSTSNATLSCAKPSVDPNELQKNIARALHANQPEYDGNPNMPKDDPRFEHLPGLYGNNLMVQVRRPSGTQGMIAVQFSFDIECGTDTMLLAYKLGDGVWTEKLRWQSPPLKSISDAFGDFFLATFLHDPSALEDNDANWRVVVAHGTIWCQSRFSNFKIDLLSPSRDPASPRVLWHTGRAYSRSDFDPQIKSSGNTFELRLNADCMFFDEANCFERRVIYRYSVDDNDSVRRLGPFGMNARGFVEEWLTAPWPESQNVSAAEAVAALQEVHDHFDRPAKPGDDQFVSHSFGPVRACAAPGVFQVQINSTLEKIVPGKPGGDSSPLPSRYFHVGESKDGYLMLSARAEPDPSCTGTNLMPPEKTVN